MGRAKWLVGTEEEPGFLKSVDLPYEKQMYSEETLRLSIHTLGFQPENTENGCFTDGHESPENRADRADRFLPEYFDIHSQTINQFKYKGELLDVDSR